MEEDMKKAESLWMILVWIYVNYWINGFLHDAIADGNVRLYNN